MSKNKSRALPASKGKRTHRRFVLRFSVYVRALSVKKVANCFVTNKMVCPIRMSQTNPCRGKKRYFLLIEYIHEKIFNFS